MQRYKTSAERAFYKSLEAFRRFRKDYMNDQMTILRQVTELEEYRRREKAREEARRAAAGGECEAEEERKARGARAMGRYLDE